tara:strand:- start:22 stop:276 length:255 start_codon:yes stop_codon:yes gene_type:complete
MNAPTYTGATLPQVVSDLATQMFGLMDSIVDGGPVVFALMVGLALVLFLSELGRGILIMGIMIIAGFSALTVLYVFISSVIALV